MSMSEKTMLTLKELHVLAEAAARNDTHLHFVDVALQWATGAQTEIDRLRAEAALLEGWKREGEALLESKCRPVHSLFSLGAWWADRPWRVRT